MRAAQPLATGYVGVVVALAAVGALREDPRFVLAAAAVSLPAGLVALVGIYPAYGLLSSVGGLVASPTRPDGSRAAWLTVGDQVLIVAAFALAAAANVALVAWLRHRRRRRSRPTRVPVGSGT